MASFSPTSMTKFHLVMSTTSTVALLVAALWISSTHHQLANAEATDKVIDAPLLTSKVAANRTIMVDINGGGDYKSIQAAIDAVPFMNPQWVIIHIRKGEYREKVRIPPNKPYIFFRGNGKGKTHIVWSQSATDNLDSATFRLESPNFIAFGISFKNDAPVGEAFTSQNQSVAAFVGHDRAAFYHCAFYSNHNTLHDYKGRHYYDHCYIQGSIDFIFGRARSIFQTCEMFVIADFRVHIHGSITAQHREDPDDSGFVFLKGKVYGIGEVYLGRAKGAYSRVVFCKTYLSKTIAPEGWSNWSYIGSTDKLFQAEYKCHGPGAATEKRVPWAKKLTEKEAEEFMSIDFISGKQWLPVWLQNH